MPGGWPTTHSILTVLEQGEHLGRRDELLGQMGTRAKIGGQPGNNNAAKNEGEFNSPSFVKSTASIATEVGLSERIVQQRKQVDKPPILSLPLLLHFSGAIRRTISL